MCPSMVWTSCTGRSNRFEPGDLWEFHRLHRNEIDSALVLSHMRRNRPQDRPNHGFEPDQN